jgi:hypothetical protein
MIRFGQEICGNLETAPRREWLETNGLGGFASSTIVGLNTRRYHGLLVEVASRRSSTVMPRTVPAAAWRRPGAWRNCRAPPSRTSMASNQGRASPPKCLDALWKVA